MDKYFVKIKTAEAGIAAPHNRQKRMDAHSTELLIKDLAIIIVASTVSMRIFSMLKLPQLLGFIIVGILLSPVTGLISSSENIAALGELGVMFMMFFVGMEFNLERLKKVFVPSFLGITFQIVSMGILGMAAAGLMGLSRVDGIFLGGVLAMSSTIVIVEIFAQRRDLSKLYAQIAIGILIIEDIFAVFLLVVLSGLSSGKLPGVSELFSSTLAILSFMITIFVAGKLLIPRLLRRFALSGNRQELIMLIFCLIMGLGELAAVSDLSLSLGAFMAGSIISGSDVSRRVEHITDPFRNLFVALFFVSVGTQINPALLWELWLPIVLISVGVIVFQSLACFSGVVLGGIACRDAYLAAINKAQIGEFSFVIAGLGISSGVMDPSIMAIAMGVSFLTVFVNPLVSSQSEAVMKFAHYITPKKVLDALEIYRRAVGSVSQSAAGSGRLKDFLPHILAIFVYTLMFSGVMFAAARIANYIKSDTTPYPDWLAAGIWVGAAALSLPMLAGVLRSSSVCTHKMVDVIESHYGLTSGAGGKLHAFLRGVFSAVIMLGFAVVYFAFVFNFLPVDDAVIILGVSLAFMALFFRKILSNFRHSLEGRFSSVIRRHLENAEFAKRDALMDSVRASRTWAKSVSEIEIGEFSDAAGKTVGELAVRKRTGAEIAAIRRGAFSIYDIGPDTRLFPEDVVILCASDKEIAAAEEILTRASSASSQSDVIEGVGKILLKVLSVPGGSALVGQTLVDLQLPKKYGVKLVGILFDGESVPSRPEPSRPFSAGDKFLCMGSSAAIEKMARKFGLISEG